MNTETRLNHRAWDPSEEAEVLTTGDVAQMLKITRSTVLSWAYRGRLAYARTHEGHLRFHRDQVEALALAGRLKPRQGVRRRTLFMTSTSRQA